MNISSERLFEKLKEIDWYEDIERITKELIKHNMNFYFVGGTLRDAIISIIYNTKFNPEDIDIVVETENYEELIKLISGISFNKKTLIVKYPQFLTLSITLISKEDNTKRIDLSLPRKEEYEKWGALPQVKHGSIKEDLFRRDFSINAVSLRYDVNNQKFEILDLFNGIQDIFNRKIRILHEKSFFDDPTRIIRAIRLSAKLKFKFEKHTLRLLNEALNKDVFKHISQNRLINEFVHILKKGGNLKVVACLFKSLKLIKVYEPIKEIIECFMKNYDKIELANVPLTFEERYLIRLFYLLESLCKEKENLDNKTSKFKKYLIQLNIPRKTREKIYKALQIFSGKTKKIEQIENWMKLYIMLYKKNKF
ncbi:MAG: hypothetical protein ABDH23_01400 [Endomicrobiia bacterium]